MTTDEMCEQIDRAMAEITRLRTERDEWHEAYNNQRGIIEDELTPALTAARLEVEQLRAALVACVAVAKAWHGHEVWDIYYEHSPEMKPIRAALSGRQQRPTGNAVE